MIIHCSKCHHEWQVVALRDQPKCDWCGARGKVVRHPARIPTAKPTVWHRDKRRYNRKPKHRRNHEDLH